MYEVLMQTLRAAVGSGAMRWFMLIAAFYALLVLGASTSRSFREWFSELGRQTSWGGRLSGLCTALFDLAVGLLVVRVLIAAMMQQSNVFDHEHGRITERNRSAVLMKWGSPHEQRELTVQHTRKRTWMVRQLRLDDGKGTITTESFWKDENRAVQAVDGRLPAVISLTEEERDVPVEQKSIVAAEIDIGLRNNPRLLGNANYAGYDDAWRLRYTVVNACGEPTTAHCSFSLPAATGLFDDLMILVNGSNWTHIAKSEESGLGWGMTMLPGASASVEVGYRSRGLEYLRYIPRRMSQTGHYRVKMSIDGIPADKLDYPIGSMPPGERLADIRGTRYELTWKLDNAMTSYDIGVKLPTAAQPQYHVAMLLRMAPVGLILLVALLVLPRLIARVHVSMGMLTVVAIAYYLHYTFMGRLADVMTGFAGPFAISATTLTGLVWGFRMKGEARRWLGVQDAMAFTALAVLYPLAAIDAERTAFWMQVFYVAILLYLCVLIVRSRRK